MHATPNNVAISTVAIDLAKDVFELAFAAADADARAPLRWEPCVKPVLAAKQAEQLREFVRQRQRDTFPTGTR